MKILEKFVKKKTTSLWGRIGNIVLGFGIALVWVIFVIFLLNTLWPQASNLSFYDTFLQYFYNRPPFVWEFFFTCIMAPLWEELAFRYIPIEIGVKLNKYFGDGFLWPIVLLSSLIFGWGHGHGPISLLIQGVIGFVLCILYIKNGYSYWSSVTLHSMWNIFCMFVQIK